MANKKRSEREILIEKITSGWFGYAVEFREDGTRKLIARPDNGVATMDELIDVLRDGDYSFYVGYDEEEYDSVANNIDGEAVDLETLQWMQYFDYTSRGNPCTPLTLACIPRHVLQQEGWSTREEVAAVGDLAVLVAELRLARELEPDESLDEALV